MKTYQRPSRVAIALVALGLFSSACGLKADTVDALQQSNPGVGGDGTGSDGTGGDGTAGDGTGSGGTGGTGGGGTGGTGGTGGGGSGGTGGGGTGGTGGSGGGTGGSGGGSGGGGGGGGGGLVGSTSIGVTDSEIRIGIHAPLSGASPLPQDSFTSGSTLYWKDKTVFGRKVVVEVMDDTYKPSGAVRVCQEMARRDFLVVGGAGTDQIVQCAKDRTLRSKNTPYISAGVTEAGLGGIKSYFALSMSYPQQGPLLVKVAEQTGYLRRGDWAVVISDTPNFADARDSVVNALKAKGINPKVIPVPKTGNDQDAANVASQLKLGPTGGYEVVYFLGQPTFFLKVVGAAQDGVYRPTWTGVGISMGLNTVAAVACQAAGGYDGRFLSPYPGLDRAPAAFRAAGGEDDIELTLWGLSELLHKALLATNGQLTRENFINQLEKATLPGATYPTVKYSPSDHFGGTAAYLLKSTCPTNSTGRYDTAGGPFS